LVVAALALLSILVAVNLLTNGEESSRSSSDAGLGEAGTTTVPETTVDAHTEVVSRLHQILRIRDQAISARNSALLQEIYTIDCPCLDGDQRLIENLKRDGLIWRGVSVSLEVQGVERVNDRLWTINAVITTSPFEIVKESGKVVRKIPGGRELSSFALARLDNQKKWLLGQASVVEERE
jgi:hypothetical protein